MYFLNTKDNSPPDFDYHDFKLDKNYNILKMAELHPEKELERSKYIKDIADQVNSYSDKYSVDEVWFCGDLGSFNDVNKLLNSLDNKLDVVLIAGDDDKIDSEKHNERMWDGWMRQINSLEPFDVANNYEIYDEGFRKEIKNFTIETAHHPNHNKRDDTLIDPDKRPDSFLENLFSINHDSNQETAYKDNLISDSEYNPPNLGKTYDLLKDSPEEIAMAKKSVKESNIDKPYFKDHEVDIMIYDHLHMPYPRTISHENISDKLILGLGARRDNHGISELMPSSSLHMLSLDDNQIHELHFDAKQNEVFEHLIFEQIDDENLEMYYHELPEPYSHIGYLPIQERFNKEDIRDLAYEQPEIPSWNSVNR